MVAHGLALGVDLTRLFGLRDHVEVLLVCEAVRRGVRVAGDVREDQAVRTINRLAESMG